MTLSPLPFCLRRTALTRFARQRSPHSNVGRFSGRFPQTINSPQFTGFAVKVQEEICPILRLLASPQAVNFTPPAPLSWRRGATLDTHSVGAFSTGQVGQRGASDRELNMPRWRNNLTGRLECARDRDASSRYSAAPRCRILPGRSARKCCSCRQANGPDRSSCTVRNKTAATVHPRRALSETTCGRLDTRTSA